MKVREDLCWKICILGLQIICWVLKFAWWSKAFSWKWNKKPDEICKLLLTFHCSLLLQPKSSDSSFSPCDADYFIHKIITLSVSIVLHLTDTDQWKSVCAVFVISFTASAVIDGESSLCAHANNCFSSALCFWQTRFVTESMMQMWKIAPLPSA